LTAAADAVLSLTKKKRGDGAILSVTSRDTAEADYELSRDPNTEGWTMSKSPNRPAGTKPPPWQPVVDVITRQGPVMSVTHILAEFPNEKENTVRSWLSRAKSAGVIEDLGWKKWGVSNAQAA